MRIGGINWIIPGLKVESESGQRLKLECENIQGLKRRDFYAVLLSTGK